MHAFILVNKNPELFPAVGGYRFIPFDIGGIDDVLALKNFLRLTINEKTAIVVRDAHKMTPEAANALLKSLEEPQDNIVYLLTTDNASKIMPTILSRCEVVREIKVKKKDFFSNEVVEFEKMSLDNKMQYFSKLNKREDAVSFLKELLDFYHRDVYKNSAKLEMILNTLSALQNNGNVTLQLTNMLV